MARLAVCALAATFAAAPTPLKALWTEIPIPGLGQPVDRVTPHPTDPDVLLAVDAAGETWRTGDGGMTWNQVATRVEQVAFAPSDPTRVYLFRQANGDSPLRISRDGGRTFEPADFPQTEFDGITTEGGLLNLTFLALAVDPLDAETVYVGNTRFFYSGGIIVQNSAHFWRTTDGGGTWEELGGEALALAVDPHDPRVVYRGSTQGLVVSEDGGETFGPIWRFPSLGPVEQIVVDPFCAGTLWLVGGERMLRSDDGGRTAVRATQGLPVGTIRSLTANPSRDGELFVGISGAIPHGSRSRGNGWSPIPGDLAAERFTGALAIAADGRLWAGSPNGVLRLDRPPPCLPTLFSLCLHDNRFEVVVEWRDFQGGQGHGRSRTLTPDTGAFWFFDPDNLELTVKVLDGRTINGHFWVFLGSLSNVGFSVTVTDTDTGAVWSYDNPSGVFASTGDPRAFSGSPPTP